MTKQARITFQPDNNISEPIQDATTDNFTLTIPIIAANRAITRISDLENNDGTSNEKNPLGKKSNFADKFNKTDIHNIIIKGSEKIIKELGSLIALKNEIKKSDFKINIDHVTYDDIDAKKGLDYDTTNHNLTLQIPTDFHQEFDAERIVNIKDINVSANPITHINSYDNEINAFKTLWDLLVEKIKNNTRNDLLPETMTSNYLTDLKSYQQATTGDIKHTLYNLKHVRAGGSHYVFKDAIDYYCDFLIEMSQWIKNFGFTTIEEILKANANGFVLANTRKNEREIYATITLGNDILKDTSVVNNKKYKGFSLTQGATINSPAITTNNGFARDGKTPIITREIGNKNATPSKKYTKWNIDAFRHANWFGGTHGGVDYRGQTTANQCRGFLPGDIDSDYKYKGCTGIMDKNLSWSVADKKITKLVVDIWNSDNLDQAIDLAFFGKVHNQVGDKDGERYAESEKLNPTYLLKFNEIAEKNKLDTLEIYFEALKHQKCGNRDGLGLTNWSTENYHNAKLTSSTNTSSQTIVEKVENAYKAIKDFLTIYKAADDALAGTDKVILQTAKTNLEKYLANDLTGNDLKIKNHWEKLINAKITNLQEKITDANPRKNLETKIKDLAEQELDGSIAKMVFNEKDTDITENNLDELVELVKIVKAAYEGYKSDNLVKLRAFKAANDGIKYQVWKIANKQKKDSDDSENWAQRALTELENKLKNAKDIAKNEMKTEQNNDEAYETVGIENLTDLEKINHIKELFKKAKAAYRENSYTDKAQSLIIDLRTAKDFGSEAWILINKYQKNNKGEKGEGYVLDAFKHLDTLEKVAAKDFDNLLKITDETKLESEITKKIAEETDTVKKKWLEEIDGPRLKARLRLDDSKDEKKLKELFGINLAARYSGNSPQENLEKIEKDITDLEAYQNSTPADEKGKALEKTRLDNAKSIIVELLKELKKKQRILKNSIEEQEKNNKDKNTSSNDNFWKKPWGIITIVGIILVILAMIVYFLKKNSSEGE